jgi:tRNA dimethylallyltransferase
MKQKLIVILGPTATGKSDLAVRLAKKFGGEVVSADSRQVYKGLNLGTGKITKREMRGINHHLLDVTPPSRIFSVADYKKHADKAVADILENVRLPIIVGGTGFYIDTLVNDASLPSVPANKELRKRLSTKTPAQLFAMLKKKDPRRAGEIDRSNPHRLIRALEIVETLGKVPSQKKKTRGKYEVLFIGLNFPADELKKRIRDRVIARMDKGMFAEAKRLHAQGLSYRRMRELGLEYRYLVDLLENRITKKDFVEQLSEATWKYAKRQMTWFKRNKEIAWLSPADTKKIEAKVKAFLW